MSQKKPTKFTICRYRQPKVEELFIGSKHLKEATKTCQLWNDVILKESNSEDLDHEFWFLNCHIKGHTTIITASSKRDYPENDAEIMGKLAEYLASLERLEGNAQKRGENKSNYRNPR